ncbi:MAG: PSD1 and planctomycete cytochrome C domain-containing protein [Verrucomicrobiota bacterium]
MALCRSALLCLLVLPPAAPAAPVSFNRDIRPLMSNTCFHCHGPDASHRKAKLRLDVREEALKPGKSGALPIVPGKPDESEILKRIFSTDEDELMPPPEEHKPFTPEQKETFRRWVAEGAVYEPHWAYTPLIRPAPPAVQDAAWPKNDIDRFIRAQQEKQGLTPSPEAGRPTLLRRLSLDLTGLPPAPEEVESFVNDQRPDAWERQVDRLLASPHHGERMAVAWLDVVRFSDTVGYHGDQNQRIFPYRDYVIDSYNNNKPFDQFTREQLAGDLLPHPTGEQLIATGFNRLNMVTREGGAQPGEYLAKYGADRTRVVGTAWLGSTFGCAECHDHKFDPISAKDFYSLQAFFADVKQWGVYSEYQYTPNPELRGYTNDHPFPPEIEVENRWLLDKAARTAAEQRIRIAEAAAQRATDPAATAAFQAWLAASQTFSRQHPAGWVSTGPQITLTTSRTPRAKAAAKPAAAASDAPPPTVQNDGTIVLPPGQPDDLTLNLQPGAGTVAALQLEILPAPDQDRFSGTVTLTANLQRQGAAAPEPIRFRFADSATKAERFDNGFPIPGIMSGWKLAGVPASARPTGVWLPEHPLNLTAGDTLTVSLKAWPFRSLRVSWSPFAAPVPAESRTWLTALTNALSDPQGAHLAHVNEAWLTSTAADAAAYTDYQVLAGQRRGYAEGRTKTLVTEAMAPLTVRIRPRGNWQDETGEITPPATPHFLPGPKPADGQRLTRLDLANWIASPENPLTARTVMNRLWKQLFGTGLSAVVDDLGAQGEPPSHPELLDWLAAEFRDSGWNTKHLIRLLVTSKTYRQHSSQRVEYKDLDPANRLLASQNPRRLEAEFVRDNALAIAGLLNPEIGGPSIKPWQPPGYYANLQFPDRDYRANDDGGQWRRGVYMHWQRTFLHPMLANFDAPMRDECAAARMVSNTPQQALTLLNDPTFAEAARVFAQRLLTHPAPDDTARLRHAWQLALARPPEPAELDSILTYLKTQRDIFTKTPADAAKVIKAGSAPGAAGVAPVELAAWTATCRVILNLHETITRF